MYLTCPHCQNVLTEAPDLAGQMVLCPHCRQAFRQPGELIVSAPSPPAIQQPQVIVLSHGGHPPQRRLEPSGWFQRGFAAASGVILAYFLFFVLFPVLVLLVLFGGLLAVPSFTPAAKPATVAAPSVAATLGTSDRAKTHAISHLTYWSIVEFDTCDAVYHKGIWTVGGIAIKANGDRVPAAVRMSVTKSGDTLNWLIVSANVDGEQVSPARRH